MPRELMFLELYLPTLMLLLGVSALLMWLLDRVLIALDVYRFFWHAPLARLSLFMCLFSALALTIYR
ncbi:hypothetical protein PMM47T1_07866 [Pseudomonas sp. M47T1]|uniref:DUF1656 domain-containing protein n=1 Tax=unclassified Pseudomonas TaxID=196821 RepID=UPI0002607228|nr:DUF1656 domain-containing protein [Pseudomonas sp. M47T1]EIK97041.1 hypothetical protein PMM47T1_07866 [Pseudomonas sp. M47T1]